jgi:hypothetical protein
LLRSLLLLSVSDMFSVSSAWPSLVPVAINIVLGMSGSCLVPGHDRQRPQLHPPYIFPPSDTRPNQLLSSLIASKVMWPGGC